MKILSFSPHQERSNFLPIYGIKSRINHLLTIEKIRSKKHSQQRSQRKKLVPYAELLVNRRGIEPVMAFLTTIPLHIKSFKKSDKNNTLPLILIFRFFILKYFSMRSLGALRRLATSRYRMASSNIREQMRKIEEKKEEAKLSKKLSEQSKVQRKTAPVGALMRRLLPKVFPQLFPDKNSVPQYRHQG